MGGHIPTETYDDLLHNDPNIALVFASSDDGYMFPDLPYYELYVELEQTRTGAGTRGRRRGPTGLTLSQREGNYQNALASPDADERIHYTIMNRMRSMIHARNLPVTLWPYAVKVAAIVTNYFKLVERGGVSMSAYEAFHGGQARCVALESLREPVHRLLARHGRPATGWEAEPPRGLGCTVLIGYARNYLQCCVL